MEDEKSGRREGLGDDQGTRIGSPTPDERRTGAGSEATEGMHSADGDQDDDVAEGDRPGSEPIESHDREHRSEYGGGSRREGNGGQRHT